MMGGRQLSIKEGVIVDTDGSGTPRGFEFLRVRALGVHVASLPPEVAEAISQFIASGALESNAPVEHHYTE